ncbi:MAG: hypothetical protein IT488_02445 [Gammaproteobacteria bacterium]|nr:hypothetical protein [Gammaproteobacteria bacterium]
MHSPAYRPNLAADGLVTPRAGCDYLRHAQRKPNNGPAVIRSALTAAIAGLVLTLLTACTASHLESGHPLVAGAGDEPSASVYFIRPRTERYLGVADNALRIEADRAPLLELAKGEYALVSMKPGPVWITVNSDTSWGPSHDIKEMSSSSEFSFAAGQTYFLALTVVDGEFRGVTYRPESVNLERARELAATAQASGAAARNAPIDSL